MSGLAHPATMLLVALGGAAFYVIVQHGSIWLGRRTERLHMWVSLWGLAALAHLVTRILHYAAPDVSAAAVALRLSLGVLVLAAILGVSTVRDIAAEQGHAWVPTAALPIHGLMLYLALATEMFVGATGTERVDLFGRSFHWLTLGGAAVVWVPWGLAIVGYCGFVLYRATSIDPAERRLVTVALVAFGGIGLWDWAVGMSYMPGPLLLDFVPVGVAIGFSTMASRRYETIQADLEVEVRKRTHEIADANKNLAMALRESQDATAVKSRFMANVSHEIRTPLNGLMASTQLLMEADLDPDTERLSRIAAKSALTLKTIVDDVLDLSAVEAGVIAVRPQLIDPVSAIDESVRMFEDQARQTGTTLELAVNADQVPPMVVDPMRLKQIVANLISNAVKYAEGGFVQVRMHATDAGGTPSVRIEVQDDGPGMPEAQTKRVFEAFHKRVHVDTTGSTGLGLAISREMVSRLGGTIGVNSRVGAGSTFWVELPIGDTAAARPQTTRDDIDSMSRIPAHIGGGRRLLVAEDNPVNQEVARLTLARLGFTCDVVNDGFEAVRQAQTGRYAAVLMDVRMPGMDGLRAARAIRDGSPPASKVPIVAITANAFDKDRDEAASAGMDAFVPKPIDIAALAATLFQLLGPAPDTAPETVSRTMRGASPPRSPLTPMPSDARLSSARVSAVSPAVRMPGTKPPARRFPKPKANTPKPSPRTPAAPPRPPPTPRAQARPSTFAPPPSLRTSASADPRQTLRPISRVPTPSINEEIEVAAFGEEDEDVDLVGLFVEDSRSRLTTLSRATASGDSESAAGAAHAMKGAAASIGLDEIRDVCESFEMDALGGRLPDPNRLNHLIRLIERL